jgi:hypothetical protein
METNKAGGDVEKRSFESCLPEIDEILYWNKSRWRLNSIAWMDFDDVCQKIRIHLFKKWEMWDQSQPLKPWVSRIVYNQIIKMIRNHYTIYAKPCVTCPHNLGGNFCALYGEQSSECDLFSKWETGKKVAHEINNPISINCSASSYGENANDSYGSTRFSSGDDFRQIEDKTLFSSDIEKLAEDLHEKMKVKLNKIQWKLYDILYIQHKTEREAAKLMGYYSSEKMREPGYKQIKSLKNQIMILVKQSLKE